MRVPLRVSKDGHSEVNAMAMMDEIKRYAKGMRVLYVEDSAGIRDETAGVLKKFFAVVDTADNGITGLQSYSGNGYDIVITDVRMPGLDGIAMIRRIKEINPEQVVLITTAYDDRTYLYELINLGVDRFLLKPFALVSLLEALLEITRQICRVNECCKARLQDARLAAMSEVLASIAHHWRQPLNVIGMNVQDILDCFQCGELNEKYLTENVESTMQAVLSLSATIDTFKRYFKADNKKERFSLAQPIEDAILIVRDSLSVNAIELIEEIGQHSIIEGNKQYFSHVILEILCNSLQALLRASPEDPYIKIGIASVKDRPVITIRNNGGPIASDILEKIFDPYFSTKSVSSGTGLGLFVAKLIVEHDMKGRLTVQNMDNGVEFRIEINAYIFNSG